MAERGTEYEVNKEACEDEPFLKVGAGVQENSIREIGANGGDGINDGTRTEDSDKLSLEERRIRSSGGSSDAGVI